MIHTTDNRFAKAVVLADHAGQWLKCRTTDGRKAYGIPSARGDGRCYLVTRTTCECEDQARHPSRTCKHRQAVEIHCARLGCKRHPMPSSDTVDGLTRMLAAKYDEIFKHLEQD